MLIKWHETFLGLIKDPSPKEGLMGREYTPRKVLVPRSAGVGRPDLADAAAFCDARTRAALNVRAPAARRPLTTLGKGRQCHSIQVPNHYFAPSGLRTARPF